MRRAFEIDVLACPQWGGRLRLIAIVDGTSSALSGQSILRTQIAHLGVARGAPAGVE